VIDERLRGDTMDYIYLINPPLLIQSYIKDDYNKKVPVGLLSLGSVLAEAGYNVHVIDGVVDPEYWEGLISTKDKNVLFYGISCMTAQIPSALRIGKLLRDIAPDKQIVWGGVHPTLFPEETCSSHVADVVVVGEGEYTAKELANAYKQGTDIGTIKGIAYKENGKVRVNPIRETKPLDELPMPRYDVLNIEDYLHKNINVSGPKLIKKSMAIYSGVGCPFNCAFCINTVFAKKLQREKYRSKSAEKVLEEVDYLINEYGVEDIHFQDELFFAKKSRLLTIVDGILERGYKITWSANVYAGYFSDNYLSDEVFEKVARSGCIRLTMGVESGCDRVLKLLRKNIKLDLVERSAQLSKKFGVTLGYSFMMGIPGETRTEVIETLKFINKLLKINQNNYILGPQLFRPYPGSDFYNIWKEKGGEEPSTLEGWAQYLSRGSSSYITVDDLPWLPTYDYDFYMILNMLARYLMPLKNIKFDKLAILRLFMYAALRLRMRMNYWHFPFEVTLLQLFRRLSKKTSSDTNIT